MSHAPMPNRVPPNCPECGQAMVWDSKWIEWYCAPCELDNDNELG